MKKKLRVFLIIAGILILAALLLCLIFLPRIKNYLIYFNDKNGLHQEDKPFSLTIDKSDFENEVAARLADNGIICSSARFLAYIHSHYPDFVWYNGIYRLNANMSYHTLCEALQNPDVKLNYVKFTVPEGKNIPEIAEIVEKAGLCTAKEFLDAADTYDYEFDFMKELRNRDQDLIGYKLEGFLFPATYEFRVDTTAPSDIVQKMLETFTQYVPSSMIDCAAEKGLSVGEFVTLASVIQGEGNSDETMKGVSSVFWNRKNSPAFTKLQSDPTTDYAKEVLSKLDHYSAAMFNAYDTYTCDDLPVGPINCPGSAALNAVLEPLDTDYYYFVTDVNGDFYFNRTLAEHNQTIRTLRQKGLWY